MDHLRDVERQRLQALVARDMATAQRLHADDYVLITPRGAALTKRISPDGTFSAQCWHTDCYRRDPNAGWQAVWSQATAIVP